MFNLNDYETVQQRIEKFWLDYPDGRIDTELVHYSATQFIVKAFIFKTFADDVPFATGLAEETVSGSGVNKNFALPNCETSAIGRALANGNITTQPQGLAKGTRPSREEMEKVNRVSELPPARLPENHQPVNTTVDPWNEAKPANPEPSTIDAAADIISNILGAEKLQAMEAPICDHGYARTFKTGTKGNKEWAGWFCAHRNGEGTAASDFCPVVWCMQKDGKWIIPQLKEKK